MTWLYVVATGALVARWGLWYLRDVVEWIETPRRDHVSAAMLARLRLQGGQATYPVDRMPRLSQETAGAPHGA